MNTTYDHLLEASLRKWIPSYLSNGVSKDALKRSNIVDDVAQDVPQSDWSGDDLNRVIDKIIGEF